jgi:hypothetical protein
VPSWNSSVAGPDASAVVSDVIAAVTFGVSVAVAPVGAGTRTVTPEPAPVATLPSHPAVTTCWTVKPAEWVTGVVAGVSAPRVTVHVVPLTFVTAMISEVLPEAVSQTWNWAGGAADDDAAGNPEDDATVHVSTVPAAGAPVPPEDTVVSAWLVKISVTGIDPPENRKAPAGGQGGEMR